MISFYIYEIIILHILFCIIKYIIVYLLYNKFMFLLNDSLLAKIIFYIKLYEWKKQFNFY